MLLNDVLEALTDETIADPAGELPPAGKEFIIVTVGAGVVDEGARPRYAVDVTCYAAAARALDAERTLNAMLMRVVGKLNASPKFVTESWTASEFAAFNEATPSLEWVASTITCSF